LGNALREGTFKTWMFRAATGLRLPAIASTWIRGVPIMAYHGVTASLPTPLGNIRRLHVPVERFETHLRVLSEECRPIALSELVDAIVAGKSLPARSVVVTFDDGYRNVLTAALPLLRKYSIPATLFVVTHGDRRMWEDDVEVAVSSTAVESVRCNGTVYRLQSLEDKRRSLAEILPALQRLGPARERPLGSLVEALGAPHFSKDDDRDLLAWEELDAWRREGMEIGSHADRHGPLTERPMAEVRAGLIKSFEMLTNRYGAARYALAYPYGARDDAISAAARDAGFCCGLIGQPGFNGPGMDLFGLKRFFLGADDDALRLRASLSGLRALGQSGRAWGLA
jgi:peptidoglycan/xylan/chitin deacetylase (PgdA/CDA1 family)